MGGIPRLAGKLNWDARNLTQSPLRPSPVCCRIAPDFARFLALTRQHSWLIVGFIFQSESMARTCTHLRSIMRVHRLPVVVGKLLFTRYIPVPIAHRAAANANDFISGKFAIDKLQFTGGYEGALAIVEGPVT
jgi:hypothetical protein